MPPSDLFRGETIPKCADSVARYPQHELRVCAQFKSLRKRLEHVEADMKLHPAVGEMYARLEQQKTELEQQIQDLPYTSELHSVPSSGEADDDRSIAGSDCTDETLPITSPISALLDAADDLSLQYLSYAEKAAAEERARYEANRAKEEEEEDEGDPQVSSGEADMQRRQQRMDCGGWGSTLLPDAAAASSARCPSPLCSAGHSLLSILN